MTQPARPFRVERPAPGQVRVEFPRRRSATAFFVLALGLGVACLFAVPLVEALRSRKPTSKYGYGLGTGMMMAAFGVILLAGRRQVLVTERAVVHRLLLAGFPVLTSEVARDDLDSIRAEDGDGDHYVRIYPRNGPRAHIEGFASKEERDWFLAQLRSALEGSERAFEAEAAPPEGKAAELRRRLLDGMVRYMKFGGAEDERDPGYDPNWDAGYAREHVDRCDRILDRYLDALRKVPADGPDPYIREAVRQVVLDLNELNRICGGGLIETDQREDLVAFILSAAREAGLAADGSDPTAEWREW